MLRAYRLILLEKNGKNSEHRPLSYRFSCLCPSHDATCVPPNFIREKR
nr:MAG TPA: hypothetical protein [Microviridae sp.]